MIGRKVNPKKMGEPKAGVLDIRSPSITKQNKEHEKQEQTKKKTCSNRINKYGTTIHQIYPR